MLTVFLTCVFFSMHICEHVKDEFPLLFAGDNKVFLILILILNFKMHRQLVEGGQNGSNVLPLMYSS